MSAATLNARNKDRGSLFLSVTITVSIFCNGTTMIQGSIVAIVTPMHEDGSLDAEALKKLLDWHIAEGTDAIVIVGTTGESPTVTVEEHCELIKLAVDYVAVATLLRKRSS
jgi:hypothetical protein